MQMFFVADSSNPDFNRDLIVMADSPEKAIASWRRYFEEEGTAEPEMVFAVHPSKRKGPLRWHGPDCKRVWGERPHNRQAA